MQYYGSNSVEMSSIYNVNFVEYNIILYVNTIYKKWFEITYEELRYN